MAVCFSLTVATLGRPNAKHEGGRGGAIAFLIPAAHTSIGSAGRGVTGARSGVVEGARLEPGKMMLDLVQLVEAIAEAEQHKPRNSGSESHFNVHRG